MSTGVVIGRWGIVLAGALVAQLGIARESFADMEADLDKLKGTPSVQAALTPDHKAIWDRLHKDMVKEPFFGELMIARPKVAASIVSHPQSLDVIESALDEVDRVGLDKMVNTSCSLLPLPLTKDQAGIVAAIERRIPKDKPRQPGFRESQKNDRKYIDAYVKQLYAGSEPIKTDLQNLARTVATATGGEAQCRSQPKGEERVMEKIEFEYNWDAAQLVDLAGCKIVYDDLAGVYRGLKKTSEVVGSGNWRNVKIVGFKQRFRSPVPSGYSDVLMNLQMRNGHIAEYRIHLKSVDTIADKIDHPLYEVSRSMAPVAKEKHRSLTDQEIAFANALQCSVTRAYADGLASGRNKTQGR
jgi:hypothetical protein